MSVASNVSGDGSWTLIKDKQVSQWDEAVLVIIYSPNASGDFAIPGVAEMLRPEIDKASYVSEKMRENLAQKQY